MNGRIRFHRSAIACLCATLLIIGPGIAQQQPGAAPSGATGTPAAAPMKQEELDQLLAPIALYPDSLLAQMFMAATYPLEIVEADRWAKANKNLKDAELTTALESKTWDASVKSLVNFPDILSMMSEKLDMTTKLGDAFIADEKRMMETVQKLRGKAKDAGNLKTSQELTVKVEPAPVGASTTEVIVIESPSPEVVYVPSYNPAVVYGSWPYPSYPPYPYYPPPPHPWLAGAVGFGVGLACGAAWGFAWGGCNWGGGNVDIDIDRNTNINNNIDRSKAKAEFNNKQTNRQGDGRGSFQHDAAHRKGVAYRDKASQQKYAGNRAQQTNQARDAYRGKAEAGRQDIARGGASDFQGRGGAGAGQNRSGAGVSAGGAQNRSGAGAAGGANRAGAGGAGAQARPAGGGAGAQARPANTVGTRSSAYDGVNRSPSQVQSASNRGASSRNTAGISGAQRPSGGVSRAPSGGGYSRPSGGGGRPAGGGGGGRPAGGGGGRR